MLSKLIITLDLKSKGVNSRWNKMNEWNYEKIIKFDLTEFWSFFPFDEKWNKVISSFYFNI